MSITITTPSGLIAGLPAMLGFVPQDSILVAFIKDGPTGGQGTVECVLRGDLTSAAVPAMRGSIGAVVDKTGCDRAVVVVVGDAPASVARTAADAIGELLDDCDVFVLQKIATAAIEQGAVWTDLDYGDQGTLDDPRSTDLALAHMVKGQVLAESRAADLAVLEPAIDAEVTRMHSLLDSIPETDEAAVLRTVLAIIGSGENDAPALAHTAHAISSLPSVRDCLLGLAVTDQRDNALAHMLEVARRAGSADAYAVVAVYEGARGATVRGWAAVDQALSLDPQHRLARLLDQAFREVITPAQLRALAETGTDMARGMGVELA